MLSTADWQHHCGELAAAAVREASGRDVWAELGGCPRSRREAAALFARAGVRNLAGMVTAVLGPPMSPLRAKRGDIVMVRGSLGVCRGEVAECVGTTVPMREAEMAWLADDRRR